MQYAIELHVHSRFSFDCLMDPARIVARAKAAGLSGVAIVDHNSLDGSIAAAPHGASDFLVIPGMEIATTHGDLIGLFLKSEIRCRDPIEAAQRIKAQDGIAILAHPFLQADGYPEELLCAVDAVEALNPRANCFPRFRRAARRIARLCTTHNMGIVGGSDAHTYGEIGTVRNMVPALDPVSIKVAIRRGEVRPVGRRSTWNAFYGVCLSQWMRLVPARVRKRLWPR